MSESFYRIQKCRLAYVLSSLSLKLVKIDLKMVKNLLKIYLKLVKNLVKIDLKLVKTDLKLVKKLVTTDENRSELTNN
jgi:hypothetical protein